MSDQNSPAWPLHLGCPVWNCADWSGRVYPKRAPRTDWLRWYSRAFNTVEGNSSFYGLPPVDTARRWADQSAAGFRFCFKFPKLISHDLQLHNAAQPLRDFLAFLEPLARGDKLGPTFLQLGPAFSAGRFAQLERFLRGLPAEFSWAVELRHGDWFDGADNEQRLDQLLSRLNIDKVIFDSRPLFQAPPDDEVERVSQSRKPKTPLRQTVTGKRPMLRIVGRNRIQLVDRFFEQWLPTIVAWIDQGLTPYVLTHAPDDSYAPELALRFLQRLRVELPELNWELSGQLAKTPRPAARQLSLLD
jgi:uncharacterized protein YecE (DUF72 family)